MSVWNENKKKLSLMGHHNFYQNEGIHVVSCHSCWHFDFHAGRCNPWNPRLNMLTTLQSPCFDKQSMALKGWNHCAILSQFQSILINKIWLNFIFNVKKTVINQCWLQFLVVMIREKLFLYIPFYQLISIY